MIQIIEIIATILGLIQGVLVMFNKRLNWIFYCLQMVALFIFSLLSKLYGDTINDVLYLALGIIAYILWGKGKLRLISVSPVKTIASYSIVTIVVTTILAIYLATTRDPLPIIDSLSTTTSILATLLMIMRRLDCWVVWLLNDALYCAEYYLLPDQAIYLFMLNALWSVMAIISFMKWERILKEQKVNKVSTEKTSI